MKPRRFSHSLLLRLAAVALLAHCPGCATPFFHGASPDPDELTQTDVGKEIGEIRFVGDVANAWGMNSQKVESIALVTGLDSTGSDPPPSPQRQALIEEMKTHDVKDPNKLLASPNTSMVLVRAYLPPAVQKGDRFDLEVRTPSGSETTALRGGWLMQSRMKEMEVLGGALRQGHILGIAEGTVLVDAAFKESEDKVLLTRGRVLGGGVAHFSRSLGLAVRSEESSIRTATLIGNAINARFHTFDHGKKVGVATPKRDNFIELAVQPRYKQNIWRYMRVIRAIAMRESASDRAVRLKSLEQKLLEPTTTHEASIQLEAIGKEAIATLKIGLQNAVSEVRFSAGEALAYLDEADAAPALAEAARDTAAFRWSAQMALASMDHVSAYDALNDLLHVPSAETRYGAFRAIRQRNPRDPIVRGENLGEDGVHFHVVNTTSEPLVHFSKSQRPEVVLFGADQRLQPPAYLYAGKQILIKGLDADHVKMIRYRPGKEEQTEICSTELVQIVPMIFKLGGDYTDVMQCLLKARKDGYLESRIAIDALPKLGRVYYRDQATGDETEEDGEKDGGQGDDREGRPSNSEGLDGRDSRRYEPDFNKLRDEPAKKGIFRRMTDWWSPASPE